MKLEYFKSEQGLEQLLLDNKEIFEMIDDYAKQFVQGILSTKLDYEEALKKLTGAYLVLEPLYQISCAYKRNNEITSYLNIKNELENKGKKVVASHIDKEASLTVKDIRRIRNILEGYVNAIEKGIISCQTLIKKIDNGEKYKPSETDHNKDEHSNGKDDNPPKSQDQIELITAGIQPDIKKDVEPDVK